MEKRMQRSALVTLVVLIGVITLGSGCAAVHTSIAKKDLDVQTKMSESIFLEPVAPDKRVIFIQVRNTTDRAFNLEPAVVSALGARGYRVTQNPEEAHFRLLANVLSVGRASPTAAESAVASGFGGALTGATAGAVVGGAAGGWRGAGIGAGAGVLAGALVGTVADASVKDVTYMVVTDVEIAERAREGVIVRQDAQQDAKQGMGGTRRQVTSEVTDMKRYRTRIVSTANKVNLEYNEAAAPLLDGITRSLSGLF